MLDLETIKLVLISSIASSIITTSLVQKIKENLKSKKYITLISFIISLIIGTLFSYNFTSLNLINNLWSGFISFIGADAIYKSFEDKIFKSFSNMKNDYIDLDKEDSK